MDANKRGRLGSLMSPASIRAAYLAVMVAALPVEGQAQEMPRFTAEIGVGLGHGAGGPPTEGRGLLVFSLQPAAVAALRSGSSAMVIAADLSVHGRLPWPFSAACYPDVEPPCTDHPGASSRSLLLGWGRVTQSGHTVRLLAGPAHVGIEQQVGAGGLARADWSFPSSPNGDFVIFGQTLVTPTWKGRRYTIMSGGIGARLGTYGRDAPPRRRQPTWRWPS